MNRAAKTALEVFDDILNKEKLDRNDLELIIEKIKVYEDHLEIQLKADIDSLLRCGELPAKRENAANFKWGMGDISSITIVQASEKRPDKVFHANVISNGDPSLITLAPWERLCFGMLDLDRRRGWGCK